MSDKTAVERAALIRTLLASEGWQLFDEALGIKLDQVRDQPLLLDSERHQDYKGWSIDRLSGLALGIGWSKKVLHLWLKKYDDMERAAHEAAGKNDEQGHGNPYGPDAPV